MIWFLLSNKVFVPLFFLSSNKGPICFRTPIWAGKAQPGAYMVPCLSPCFGSLSFVLPMVESVILPRENIDALFLRNQYLRQGMRIQLVIGSGECSSCPGGNVFYCAGHIAQPIRHTYWSLQWRVPRSHSTWCFIRKYVCRA